MIGGHAVVIGVTEHVVESIEPDGREGVRLAVARCARHGVDLETERIAVLDLTPYEAERFIRELCDALGAGRAAGRGVIGSLR